MAPVADAAADLAKRVVCGYGYYWNGSYCAPNSSWYWWGRWVFAGIVIVLFILALLAFGCVSSRRRRSRGLPPVYGTGWMAPPAGKYNYNNPNGYNAPPPPYGQQNPQYTGTTFNPNDGYYGNRENIELQQPQNSYQPRPGENVYEPPAGPPPGKHDGVIR